jgi:hypothetical protein
MSTKAIREALGAAAMAAPDTCNEDLARKVAAAWSEVEAIEKAAKSLDVWSDEHPTERSVAMQRDAGDAFGLMAIIARDTK